MADSSFAATLSSKAIFAVSEADLKLAVHFCTVQDYAALDEMDRESKINTFNVDQKVNVVERKWDIVSFTFPGKTKVLYTATEFVTD